MGLAILYKSMTTPTTHVVPFEEAFPNPKVEVAVVTANQTHSSLLTLNDFLVRLWLWLLLLILRRVA